MGRYLDTAEHKHWRKAVIDRDGGACVICGKSERLTGHHLIPKEQEEHRSNITNGITLCGRHHGQYGFCISPHNDSAFIFTAWMMEHRHEQFIWVMENWHAEI